MKEALTRLIDLKSLITMAIVFTLVNLTMRQMPIDPFFSTIAGLVLGFYFGKAQTPTPNTTTTTETTTTDLSIEKK